MYFKKMWEYENEKYVEFICTDKNPMRNEYFMEDIYRYFNKEPKDLCNNNFNVYKSLRLYTGCSSIEINSLLHSNEELIKNNKSRYSEDYFEIEKFLKEYYTIKPIITYRVVLMEYIENAINKKDFFKGLVSTGCVLSSLSQSNGAFFAKHGKKAIVRIFVPKYINCVMLPKEVAQWEEDVEILILNGYSNYEIEKTEEECRLGDYTARIYNLYLKI